MNGVITIFTDGASRGNPGPGGWGAIIISAEGKVVELGGREDQTTNNRMELAAARAALEYIEARKLEGPIQIHTDSAYLLQGVTGWVYGWEKNGWKTRTGEPVLNQDLWKDIGLMAYRQKMKRAIEWIKVSGHAGLNGNERADAIATGFADGAQVLLFVGPVKEYEKYLGGSVFDGESSEKKEKKKRSDAPAYSYVSMVGGLIEVHKTWAQCEARVKGKSGARFKKVFSLEEEQELIKLWTAEHLAQP